MRASRARPRPDTPGLVARRAAASIVARVLLRGEAFDEAPEAGLPGSDAALARAIAAAAFRRWGAIRHALVARLPRGLPAQPWAQAVLATGAAQLLVLDVPDHAAVDLAVRLAAEERSTAHLTGLVNAVLRRLGRERAEVEAAMRADPLIDVPAWLARRWIHTYGAEKVLRFAAAHGAGAALDLTVRQDPDGWAQQLGGEVLPTGTVRVTARGAVEDLPGYAGGAWWVQDAAASIPARLLAARPGQRVLDLCAAPGGKTAQLAASGATVTAVDRSGPRLVRLRTNLDRLGLTARIVEADAFSFADDPFDAVLLDAPCTGTGTLRRHPDIAWAKREADLASLVSLQARLLDRAADLVRPGGRLVYCVCSLEPEEGERQAEAVLLRRPDLAREPVATGDGGIEPGMLTRAGELRTTPDLWPREEPRLGGLDGFFAARFRRLEAG